MSKSQAQKKRKREEKQLLEEHPKRRCGFVFTTRERDKKRAQKKKPVRCPKAGRWEIVTQEGDVTYDAKTFVAKTDPGRLYACNWHAAMMRANGVAMKQIA